VISFLRRLDDEVFARCVIRPPIDGRGALILLGYSIELNCPKRPKLIPEEDRYFLEEDRRRRRILNFLIRVRLGVLAVSQSSHQML
jgi:hypothetical protein